MKNRIILILLTILFSGCVNNSFDTPVQEVCVNPGLTKTKEVANIYTVAINPVATPPSIIPNTPLYTTDDIIEAYVISSDEGGNFYKSMYFQPLDGSKGFNLSVDEVNVYTKNLQPGRKVFLKLKGLAYANPTGTSSRGLIFGAKPTEQYPVDRLSGSEYTNFLVPSCDLVSEELFVKHLTISQALSTTYLNTLVEVDDVQFKTDCATFSQKDFDTSLKITNGTTTLDVRTSRFANFAGYTVPAGRGKIRGILTKYGATYQIILRTERDVAFTKPRIPIVSPPKVGANLNYSGAFIENFGSYANTTTGANFPKYINDAAIGFKYWDVFQFPAKTGNKYIQVSAYNNGCTKSYFIVPVNMTAANGFSFKTNDGFNDGNPLHVYYSTNYVPGNNVSQATLVDITSKFKISSGNTSGYGTGFISSGIYPIPATLSGNGYFIFEYDGTTGISTTMQIDDVIVN